ncbi:MAG: lipooligosaccharide transport system permease protein, partial [Frankiales bacterium]|nr:lipooligosaccharide transport system permease protein [Frankiales bacterium]
MADTLVLDAARLVVVRHWWVVRSGRPWATLVNGLFEPFLYLMSIGV